MIRKFYIAVILALMLSFSFEARADKDFIQKIQTAVEKAPPRAWPVPRQRCSPVFLIFPVVILIK